MVWDESDEKEKEKRKENEWMRDERKWKNAYEYDCGYDAYRVVVVDRWF